MEGRWGRTRGVVDGYTMCRQTRSSTLRQTAPSSWRESQSGRAREKEGKRWRVIILPYCLSVITGMHTSDTPRLRH